MTDIRTDCRPGNDALNALNRVSWGQAHSDRDYAAVLDRSLGHVCAFDGESLIGFVNIAWDGGVHAFLLDTCVAPDFRRRGVATALVKTAVDLARARGAQWLHVDFEPHLVGFYQGCGFRPTGAGLIDLVG